MKVNPTIACLLLGSLMVASAQQAIIHTPFDSLTNHDRLALAAEVQEWRRTRAGQSATQHGFMPASAAEALTSLSTTLPYSSGPQPSMKTQLGASKSVRHNDATTPDGTNATTFADPNVIELLKRYHDGKRRIAQLAVTQPKATFSMQTPFALMTPEEFHEYVGGHRSLVPDVTMNSTLLMGNPTRNLRQMTNPDSIDWVASGVVTTPRDQGTCNACAVFSTVAAIESGYAIAASAAVPSLSEQDVISCGPLQGSCSTNGRPHETLDWIVNYNGGSLCTKDSFPYGAWSSSAVSCARYDDPSKACYKPDLGVVGYVQTDYPEHPYLEDAVATRPVAVIINSKPSWFQYYSRNVLLGNENECPSDDGNLNHAALIVGYGTDEHGTKYWKAKNSWGTSWGEGGYFRIERGYQGATYGACGIERLGTFPRFRANMPSADNMRCAPARIGHQTLGSVMKEAAVQSTLECCDTCRATPGCVAVNFNVNGGNCKYLSSNTGDQLVGDSGAATIVIRSKSEVNGQCSPVENNIDYGGNDLMRLMTTTSGDCCDACMRNPSCTAYTWSQWNTGSCFLKSKRGSSITSHPPNADGSPYYVSGEAYKCQGAMANTDIPGQDLSTAAAAHPYSCCGICRTTSGCAAFTWTNYNGGTCWLKTGSSFSYTHWGAVSVSVF